MPTFMARKAEAESAASPQSVGVTSGAIQGTPSLDARTLFYGNQLTPGANAFVPPGSAGSAAEAAAAATSGAPAAGHSHSDRKGRCGSCREHHRRRFAPRRARQHLARRQRSRSQHGSRSRRDGPPEADSQCRWFPVRRRRCADGGERSGAAPQALRHTGAALRGKRAEAVVRNARAESPDRGSAIAWEPWRAAIWWRLRRARNPPPMS